MQIAVTGLPKDTENQAQNLQQRLEPTTDAPDPVGVFVLQADTFTDKFVDGGPHLRCETDVENRDKQGSGGFIRLLLHL